jgi:hypothetical protein
MYVPRAGVRGGRFECHVCAGHLSYTRVCMYVCMYVCMHVCATCRVMRCAIWMPRMCRHLSYTCLCMYSCIVCMYACMYVCATCSVMKWAIWIRGMWAKHVYVCMYVCMYVQTWATRMPRVCWSFELMYLILHTCMRVCVCLYVCICVCVRMNCMYVSKFKLQKRMFQSWVTVTVYICAYTYSRSGSSPCKAFFRNTYLSRPRHNTAHSYMHTYIHKHVCVAENSFAGFRQIINVFRHECVHVCS